jgi:hypothetical protein
MKLRRLALLPVLLLACSEDAVEPRSGTWNYGGSKIASNSCGNDALPTDASGPFKLTVTGDGAFTINDGDFETAFECTYDGDEFSCPNRAAGMYKVDFIDATLFYEVSVSGTIVNASELTGTQVVKARCEGASCMLAADQTGYTLPCEYSFTFDAIAQ